MSTFRKTEYNDFNTWLDEKAESGIHLVGLTPFEYGQSIWASMINEIALLKEFSKVTKFYMDADGSESPDIIYDALEKLERNGCSSTIKKDEK